MSSSFKLRYWAIRLSCQLPGAFTKSIDHTIIRGPDQDLTRKALRVPAVVVSILQVSFPMILRVKIKTIYEAEDINEGRFLAANHRAEFCNLLTALRRHRCRQVIPRFKEYETQPCVIANIKQRCYCLQVEFIETKDRRSPSWPLKILVFFLGQTRLNADSRISKAERLMPKYSMDSWSRPVCRSFFHGDRFTRTSAFLRT